ncbi:CASP-like protein 1D1 [Aristolochia californica]|uniref:CASP-like protein 1D1 n=1 Tax=Aristolochia californica TaxID=171875 RepID=UPI0035E3AD2F
MASTDKVYENTATESRSPAPPPATNLSGVDFTLRFLVFASTLTAFLVLVTSKQSEIVTIPVLLLQTVRSAKFQHSPAFIYLVVAMCVACAYSILTIATSISSIFKPSRPSKSLMLLVFFDALMAGIVASATGAAGGVAYIGLKGNSHVGWVKICGTFDKFCKHVGSSIALAVFASVLLVLLVMISTYSLYRRSR